MKRFFVITALIIALAFTGCASSGGSSAASLPPFEVDLSTMSVVHEVNDELDMSTMVPGVRNVAPLAMAWRWFVVLFGENSLPPNVTEYTRVTIETKYYGEGGVEIEPGDGNMQLALFFDVEGDVHTDYNPNLAFKEMNVMGYSGVVNKDNGVRARLKTPPQGIMLQASNDDVRFIEITRIVFHTGSASGLDQ